MDWARILAYVTGTVDQELLARNEYLAAENRILKAQLNGRLKLSDAEREALGEIGRRLGRKALATSRPSGEGQRPAVSSGGGSAARGAGAVPRAIGRPSALLPSRSGVIRRRPIQFFDVVERPRRFRHLSATAC